MVEIGTTGWPWRASGITIGAALAAETDGAHVVWCSDRVPVATGDWSERAGALLALVPDPHDVADPVVTASAALLVTRRARVGILGWDPGPDPARAGRTLASLADLAPDRGVVAIAADDTRLRAVAAALASFAPLASELAVYGDDPAAPAALGWGWIAPAMPADDLAKAAGDAGVAGPLGVHLPVVVHADAAVARRAASSSLLAPLTDSLGPDRVVVGDVDTLEAVIDDHVERGITRIVLDDLLAFGAPDELEAARAAVRSAVRSTRLRHRDGGAR
jgi:hypothetical protein